MSTVLSAARSTLYLLGAIGFGAYGLRRRLSGERAPRLPLDPADVRRVLVVRLDLLGDAVFSIPAIEALAAAFPEARIDVLALPYTASIFRRVPAVGMVHELNVNTYRRPRGLAALGDLTRTVRALRAEQYDVAVGLSRLMGGVFAALSGARWRVGHVAETYAGCYNVALPGRRYERGEHEVQYCLEVVAALTGAPPSAAAPAPILPIGDESWARRNCAGVHEPGSDDVPPTTSSAVEEPGSSPRSGGLPPALYAVLVPGASNGAAKRWPAPLWTKLADRIARELDLTVVVSGSAGERHLAEVVAAPLTPPPLVVAGETSVEDLPALLAGAEVVVAGDTGPLHLAAALGTPVVGIYGPTDPRNTGPLGPRTRTVRLGIGCSPCYDLTSPADCKLPDRSVACMWGLTPDRVFDSVAAVLGGRTATASR